MCVCAAFFGAFEAFCVVFFFFLLEESVLAGRHTLFFFPSRPALPSPSTEPGRRRTEETGREERVWPSLNKPLHSQGGGQGGEEGEGRSG